MRAVQHFRALGLRFRQLMTDNHWSYTKSHGFAELLHLEGIEHITIPPHTPPWNGKVEAYFHILSDEVLYARPYRSEAARERALRRFDHTYNHRRPHGEIGGLTLMERLRQDLGVHNVLGQNI